MLLLPGVNYLLRKAANLTTGGTTQLSDLGDNRVRINTVSTLKSSDVSFTIGVESDETTMDGRKVKVKFYLLATNDYCLVLKNKELKYIYLFIFISYILL